MCSSPTCLWDLGCGCPDQISGSPQKCREGAGLVSEGLSCPRSGSAWVPPSHTHTPTYTETHLCDFQ